MADDNRRAPAVYKDIETIDPEEDIRVRIIGTVLNVKEDSIMVDDGTGTTEVFLDEDAMSEVTDGMRVRVLGRVLPTPESFEIQGEILQDMTELDMEQFKQVRKQVGDELL